MIRIPIASQPVFESLYEELSALSDNDFPSPPSTVKATLTSLDAAIIGAACDQTATGISPSGNGPRAISGYEQEEAAESQELSVDPNVVYLELGLKPDMARDELAALRRQFAARNHPDKAPLELRSIATRRMMIANAFFDAVEAAKT